MTMSTLNRKFLRHSLLSVIFTLWAIQVAPADTPAPQKNAAPEFRALWVDAFHAGIRSAQEAEQLVAEAKRANFNSLIVQVRRRGDGLYLQSFEPPLDDPAYDPKFDALASIIDVAHREGLEVHAWVNAMPVWRDDVSPRDPRHVFNQHGPAKSGAENWLTASPSGDKKFPVGYFLDPGHPAAAAYTAEVYLNLVRHYKIDGIHFDYIRYPETDTRLPRGSAVGYNEVSLERFRRATGRTGNPEPGDEQWIAWRRKQVTQLVRRVYIEAKTINPKIKVSAALIPWGAPPTNENDFADASPMQRVFQDWHAWLKEGILDLGVPMNYAREHDPQTRGWFNGWIAWEKQHSHGRQLAVGVGAYLNTPENTLSQIQRVRAPAGRHRAVGVSFFSYSGIAGPANGTGAATASQAERMSFFTMGVKSEKDAGLHEPAFAQPAPVPKMDWIDHPSRGWLAGTVRDSAGHPVDGARVRLKRAGWFGSTLRAEADGNGWFGFAELKPGRYTLRMELPGKTAEIRVDVSSGHVTHSDLVAP